MTGAIADHWGQGDVCGKILDAMRAAGLSPETVTVEQLTPVDHLHARGFPATVELADKLPIREGQRLVDIGCGIGGPARYIAKRFGCRISGVDITPAFVEAAQKLSVLVGMEGAVDVQLGDGHELPYGDEVFDGGYAQHVTMNVADRPKFFAEVFRVLKPGAFFALTEHGLGSKGQPVYPCPWSDDGSGAYLVTPEQTRRFLEDAGFESVEIEDTGEKYLAGYRKAMELAARGELPPFGTHILLGETAPAKTRNAALNIEEGRTHPIQVICRKPAIV